MEKLNRKWKSKIETIYLHNFYYNYPASSAEEMCSSQGGGGHLQINSLSKELVDKMHQNGKIVAVWIDETAPKDVYQENDAFYERLYDLGVDMVTTDFPERAESVLQRYHQQSVNTRLNAEIMNCK
jgi:glycerophosphoryl diester phosphodiesterase